MPRTQSPAEIQMDTDSCVTLPTRSAWAQKWKESGPGGGGAHLSALEAFLEEACVWLSLDEEDCRMVQG